MHPAQIKALLTIAGHKQKDVADELGVTPTSVNAVISGRSRSKQVEEWIAAATGRPLLELWPQWYGEGELTLSDDERQLVRAYRDLSATDRQRALALLKQGRIEQVGSRAPGHVIARDGSIAAGGNVIRSRSGRDDK